MLEKKRLTSLSLHRAVDAVYRDACAVVAAFPGSTQDVYVEDIFKNPLNDQIYERERTVPAQDNLPASGYVFSLVRSKVIQPGFKHGPLFEIGAATQSKTQDIMRRLFEITIPFEEPKPDIIQRERVRAYRLHSPRPPVQLDITRWIVRPLKVKQKLKVDYIAGTLAFMRNSSQLRGSTKASLYAALAQATANGSMTVERAVEEYLMQHPDEWTAGPAEEQRGALDYTELRDFRKRFNTFCQSTLPDNIDI